VWSCLPTSIASLPKVVPIVPLLSLEIVLSHLYIYERLDERKLVPDFSLEIYKFSKAHLFKNLLGVRY
jgi:hypothetical protein